jgi:hypothetical protein
MRNLLFYLFLLGGTGGYAQVPDNNNPTNHPSTVNTMFVNELDGRPISYYLGNPDIDGYSKLFYQGKFAASEDAQTYSFLDSVLTSNAETRPFYVYVFNSVMTVADGALAEHVAENCWKYFEKFPCEFFSLKKNPNYSKNYKYWFDNASLRYYYEEESLAASQERLEQLDTIVAAQCSSWQEEFDRMKKRVIHYWEEN